jgi:hypothetical protein
MKVDMASAEMIHVGVRRLTPTYGPAERNRAVHRLLVDGLAVGYRRKDGSIAAAQARRAG